MIVTKKFIIDDSDSVIHFLSFMPHSDKMRVILKINQKYYAEIDEYDITSMKEKLISNGINIDFEWEYPEDLYPLDSRKFINIDEFISYINVANLKANKKKYIKNAYTRMFLRFTSDMEIIV